MQATTAVHGKLPKEASGIGKDRARFEQLRQRLLQQLQSDKAMKKFARNLRFTEIREGLRIDMVDEADFTMFVSGTDLLTPDAVQLLGTVADTIRSLPNGIIIRGHTDAQPVSRGLGVNNWQISSARAEATRAHLTRAAISQRQFVRIEGVADREPYIPSNPYDPRNRRMSITLGWRTVTNEGG